MWPRERFRLVNLPFKVLRGKADNMSDRVMITKASQVARMRHGVTLMETLFAIGVLMVGLLGITAVLSTAGKNAVDSRTLSHSQILANSWLKETYARNMQNPSNWVRPVYDSMNDVLGWPSMAGYAVSNPNAAYCIDPLGITAQPMVDPNTLSSSGQPLVGPADSNYTRFTFPYYQVTYNPLVDPTISASGVSGVAWGNMPRMLRLNLGAPGVPVNGKFAEEMFASADELVASKARDGSIPVSRGFEGVASSSGFLLQKESVKQEFSWFATLTPKEGNAGLYSPLYTLSIVVVKNRDRYLEIPPPSSSGLNDPRSVPSQETVAWVVPLAGSSGFSGGGGGRALLISSAATESHVASGQWIMLSRFAGTKPVFGWYRVAACDHSATIMKFENIPGKYSVTTPWVDPFGYANVGAGEVWVREVTLAGRDWELLSGGSGNQATTATIVRGAVNVHERVISLDAN
jgi:hypothetical protein